MTIAGWNLQKHLKWKLFSRFFIPALAVSRLLQLIASSLLLTKDSRVNGKIACPVKRSYGGEERGKFICTT